MTVIPQPDRRKELVVGTLQLPQTAPGKIWEVKLELIKNSVPGTPVMKALDTIIFKRLVSCTVLNLLQHQQVLTVAARSATYA